MFTYILFFFVFHGSFANEPAFYYIDNHIIILELQIITVVINNSMLYITLLCYHLLLFYCIIIENIFTYCEALNIHHWMAGWEDPIGHKE